MNTITSIYIPRMSTHWTEITIRNEMLGCKIGYVTHVDFTPINKKPGFGENVDSVVMSAFVHFSNPVLKSDGHYHFRDENCPGSSHNHVLFWATIESDQPYKMKVGPKEYWICLKNKNPVQRTMMNIHQVVENGRYLENLVTAQAEEIKNLKEAIANLQEITNQLFYQVQSIYHLDCNGFVCTDQGDENRKRIENLEDKIKNLEDDLNTYGVL